MKIFLQNIVLILISFFFFQKGVAQDSIPVPIASKQVLSDFNYSFKHDVIEFKKGEMISNVLAVHNNKSISVKFSVDLSIPNNWKVLSKKNNQYELGPGDSLFIPFHVLPKVNLRGSTRFLFTAYLYNEKDEPLGYSYFYASVNKHISWSLNTPENKIYLLNGETSKNFNIFLMNTGLEDQDVHLTLKTINKNAALLDSSGEFNAKVPLTFKLNSQDDTSLYYKFTKRVESRNFRMVDLEGYNPYAIGEEHKYSVFINSTPPNPAEANKFRASQRINFIQLSDRWEVNPYGTDVIPLTFDMNAYNILGDNPMMNIDLRGQTIINEKSSIVYNSQLSYGSNIFSANPYQNASLYLGYYHSKFNVQYGNIAGGIIGTYQNGQGIKAEYYIDPKQKIGAFYTNSPRVFSKNPNYSTFGLTHSFQNKLFRINTQFGHCINNLKNKFTDVLNINASTTFIKNHSFGIRGGISRNVEQDSVSVKYGYNAGIYYSGKYLHKKINSHISGFYTSPEFGITSFERLTINAINDYKLNEKWVFLLKNNYYKYPHSDTLFQKQNYQLNNQLNFTRINAKAGNFVPFLFYNISRIEEFRVHARGLGLNLGKYNLIDNYRYFFNVRFGYNQALDTTKKNFFFLQTAGMIQIRTFSFITRYSLGNFSVSRNYFLHNSEQNPQLISLTLRHQYVFRRSAFIMQNSAGYSYSTLSGKSINLYPEIYCYSISGWRFRIFAEFNFSIGSKNNSIREIYYTSSGNSDVSNPEWNKSFYLGTGIRKEFGIPIPKTRKKYCTAEFISFYDVNGDGKKDRNEDLIENAVIKVDTWEVITNKEGEATLLNIPAGIYLYNVFSIVDLNGWFPHTNDTLYLTRSGKVYVPFTRGVKVTGKVFLDRDKMNADAEKPFDLSRIKISAVNDRTFTTLTSFDGTFEIYVPMGNYTLTMDEKVLGDKFQLLQNNFELIIDEKFDNLFVPFYVIEKRRKVKVIKFDSNGNRIDE